MKCKGNEQRNGVSLASNLTGDKMKVELRIKKVLGEWTVQWIQDGVYDEAKTYYTDGKQDAIKTKEAIIKAYSKTDYTNIVFVD